ncbi:ATP synthase CF0 B' subunit (plastid) [Cryptomonas paramecium]|uniref:ATP synthase CF0 B' subunit n=1 Tax=Cryptomonas paramaecium TaxID=2898 RepID=D2IS73_9CRYP|nr:ATP synthase CF0 B' subunit [Cryptomonas paramecium]ACT46765.1 ATP synthase CF0 B' subunit [Cryptomonas paramecium]BDA98030.1 ATP synthase CF0 B' subunit [Cryptomonas paramecium]
MLFTSIYRTKKPRAEKISSHLFYFNATLPIVAIQVLVLMSILNKVFYKPVKEALQNRKLTLHKTQLHISELMSQANYISKQNQQQLNNKKREAHQKENTAQERIKQRVSNEVKKAQTKIEQFLKSHKANLLLEKDKNLQLLNAEANNLAINVEEKLLPMTNPIKIPRTP